MNIMKKMKTLMPYGLLALSMAAGSAAAQNFNYNKSGEVINDKVMYSIGGGAAVGAPSSVYRPQGIGLGVNWNSNLMCGNMDIATTLQNQLNGVTNGFQQIMGQVIDAASGAVASLPAMLIQRANPGLYELLSNGVMQGRIDFDRSKLTCQAITDKVSSTMASGGWQQLATAQTAKQILGGGGQQKDAVKAVEQIEKNKGEEGIPWIGGKKAGGKGQDPIKLTESIVTAGYNSLHKRSPTSTASISKAQCQGGGVCTAWSSPKEAAEWATRVVGENEIQTCEKNCDPVNSTAGGGLTPLIQEEYEKKIKAMEVLLSPGARITTAKLEEVSSDMVPVSRRVIEALREDPDQDILARRLISETALTSVLEKGLLMQRTLQAGSRDPHVEQAKPAQEGIQKSQGILSSEIDSLKTEIEVRRALNGNTAMTILERKEAGHGTSKPVQEDDPEKLRLEEVQKQKVTP